MTRNRPSPRTVAAGLCGVLGVLALLLGSTLSLGNLAVFNSSFFADRVAASLSDERTSSWVAEQITNAVVEADPDLILVRPLIKAAAQSVVSSAPFRAVAREGARRSHALMTSRSGQDVLLSVSDFGVILREGLADRPELAKMIPADVVLVLGRLEDGPLMQVSAELFDQGQQMGQRPRIIFFLGILLLAVSVVLAHERERALLRAGVAVTSVAGLTLLIYELGAYVVVRLPSDPALGQALAGVWSTFVAGFRVRVMIVGGTGLVMAAAATAFLEVMNLEAIGRTLRRFVAEPFTNRWLRLARGLTLVGVGLLVVMETQLMARIVTGLAGALLGFVGLRELCRLAVDPAERLARQVQKLEASEPRQGRWLRRTLVGLAVTAILVPSAILVTRTPEAPAPESAAVTRGTMGCNGLYELCDRPLDQVVFACTHNAMGAAEVPGWLFPSQQFGIRRQLEDGVRALMLDVLPGIPLESAIKTDLDEADLTREKLEPVLGAQGMEAALRIRGRMLGEKEGEPDLYLCHALCEIGALRLVPVLEEIRGFLEANPREVLILIFEDSVPPTAVERAFIESGLVDMVHLGPVTPPWPTLGEMVQSGGRVLVLGENDTDGVDWYHPAWEVVQETRYNWRAAAEFDCAPNRGGTAGSLLLVNHWVNTPPTSRPSDAEVVNAQDALQARLAECERTRGMMPNIIAVDFYGVGDLLEVVEDLNQNPLVAP